MFNRGFGKTGAVVLVLVGCLMWAAAACAGTPETAVGREDRAAWLLNRAGLQDALLTGGTYHQTDFGGGLEPVAGEVSETRGERPGLYILASGLVPGLGEVLMGKWHGWALIAVDLYSWSRIKANNDEGDELEVEYLQFADDHWSEDLLVNAYNRTNGDIQREGLGLDYFEDVDVVASVSDLDNLSLWVSKEDDRREYYENLGKWDQFVFGWDDFIAPEAAPLEYNYTPDLTLNDLRQPWTSFRREKYRSMREASNDAYKRADRFLYVNIGLRVFSMLEVAYFKGLLGGGDDGFDVAGHKVNILAEPRGREAGTLAASVSF